MSEDIQQLIPTAFEKANAALLKYKQGKYAKGTESAKNILKDEEASALAVFLATQQFLGSGFLAWEPESIWLELKDQGIDLPRENRDKLSAAMTIILRDSFRWDALVFEKIVEAFNSIPSAPDAVQEASPGMIAWAVFEMEPLAQHVGFFGKYDYEPVRYTALSMHRNGLVVAPELLSFAQEDLDNLNKTKDLKASVIEHWGKVDKTSLETLSLKEDPIDIQIGHLAAVHLYVGKKIRKLLHGIEIL